MGRPVWRRPTLIPRTKLVTPKIRVRDIIHEKLKMFLYLKRTIKEDPLFASSVALSSTFCGICVYWLKLNHWKDMTVISRKTSMQKKKKKRPRTTGLPNSKQRTQISRWIQSAAAEHKRSACPRMLSELVARDRRCDYVPRVHACKCQNRSSLHWCDSNAIAVVWVRMHGLMRNQD